MDIPSTLIKDLSDFSFLKKIAEDNQIIGLGEATHGNKEFHVVRADISKYLIKECHFTGVIMEFPYSKSDEVNKYILRGKGDLNKIMNSLGYWTCATEEIKDFIIWLRKFNQNNKKKVLLFGNDVDVNDKIRFKPGKFRDKKTADTTLKIADSKHYVVWAHNHHISKFEGGDFTSMGYFLSKKTKYYNIATLFFEGSLTAMEYNSEKSQWGDVKSFKLTKAEKGSLEAKLKDLDKKSFFMNINQLPVDIQKKLKDTKVRFLGAGFDPKEKSSMFQSMNFVEMFDGLIFLQKVTPSVLVSNN